MLGNEATSGLDKFGLRLVWLIFASSFVVIFEPAPTDLFAVIAISFMVVRGLNIAIAIMPLVLLLVLYNIGALTSYAQIYYDREAMFFVITSVYMSISAIFIACFVAEGGMPHFELIKSGFVFGATIAAIIALAGYFDPGGFGKMLVHSGANGLILQGRATGAFKDPNVFSTYLILPTVMLIEGFLTRTNKRPRLDFLRLLILFVALFLAFSRGAWINVLMATAIMVFLTFILTQSTAMRGRIGLYAFGGALLLGIILFFLLTIPSIQSLFLDRFTLLKSYDSGERGRFGNQLNAIPMLLERPLGFGPFQYRQIFNLDPHNTFINAFASCGWLGGVTYLALVGCNIFVGLRTVFTPSPYQSKAILVFSCLIAVMFQGVQIDTEHWRHFYWMLGLMWGLFAATLKYTADQRASNAAAIETQSPYVVIA